MNVFYDVVAPEIRSPRDLNRLMNALSVTWPAMGEDVDSADFLGMESLRILQPPIYHALRANKEQLCGAQGTSKPKSEELDAIFFGPEKRSDLAARRRSLMRLFAKAFTSYSWSHSMGFGDMGDRVSKRNTQANVDSIDLIMDGAEFRRRVEKLAEKKSNLALADVEIVRTFLNAWRRRDKNPRG